MVLTGGTLTGTLAGGGNEASVGGIAVVGLFGGAAAEAAPTEDMAAGGSNGGCWAGAGEGTGRFGGVGAGTGELLVPLLRGKLGGRAPGNSRFRDVGVEAKITELASEPCKNTTVQYRLQT